MKDVTNVDIVRERNRESQTCAGEKIYCYKLFEGFQGAALTPLPRAHRRTQSARAERLCQRMKLHRPRMATATFVAIV
jgi:hypothetical protein